MNKNLSISTQKRTGAHFTPARLAEFIAETILKSFDKKNQKIIRVLDPACGDGELLMAINKIAVKKGYNLEVIGVDSDLDSLNIAKERLNKAGYTNYNLINDDFLDIVKRMYSFDLFKQPQNEISPVDIIIANPPYVRTQVMGADKSQKLGIAFGLKGKVDLYQIFLVAMTKLLKINGEIGVITSNRYLTTKSGNTTRKFLISNYNISEIIDLGDTKFFDAAVLPAILFGTKVINTGVPETIDPKPRFRKIYEDDSNKKVIAEYKKINNLLKVNKNGVYLTEKKRYMISTGIIVSPENYKDPWIMATDEEFAWYQKIQQKSWGIINDIANVKVGIKTTADSVFIRSDWDNLPKNLQPEKKLLHPLVSSKNAVKWKIDLDKEYQKILYPHVVKDGKRAVIDLKEYPKAKNYFEYHKERLAGRKYVIKANREWYEIWVPHNPDKWKEEKIVFPDISQEPNFFYDDKGTLVDGNCYWITVKENIPKDYLFLIMGIANSKFMSKYHDIAFQNKLYSGRRRYITQYVSQYPLIDPKSMDAENIISLVKEIVFNQLSFDQIQKNMDDIEKYIFNYYSN